MKCLFYVFGEKMVEIWGFMIQNISPWFFNDKKKVVNGWYVVYSLKKKYKLSVFFLKKPKFIDVSFQAQTFGF